MFKLIIIGMALFLANAVQSQVAVSVNIGSPPLWGPAGYTGARYYYLPDVESYYDVQSSMFIYNSGGVWVHRAYLPERYRSYDLYGGYKVVMKDYRGNTPYTHFNEYKLKYNRGYHGEAQRSIGVRPGNRNPVAKNSHEVNKGVEHGYVKSVGHDNVKGNPHSNIKNIKEDHGHENGNRK